MILSNHQVRVWLYQRPTDMRKSFTGLIALVKRQLAEDPLSGHLFVFINRRRNYMKVLYFAQGGFCIWSKRLTQGEFAFDRAGQLKRSMHWNELMWLIDGIDIKDVRYRKRSVFAGESHGNLVKSAHEQRTRHRQHDSRRGRVATAQDKALEAQAHELAEIKRQLDWFKRQLFGRKSEQRLVESPDQLRLTDLFPPPDAATAPSPAVVDVPSHKRRKQAHAGQPADSSLRFDAREVPVQEVRAPVPELEGPERDHYEVIREEVTYRLAQRPGSYVVLKHIRPVLKRKADAKLLTVPAPAQVFEKSIADVSFVAGMLVDKFIYHMPLYRQHQRLATSHIEVNRATLTHLVEKAALLLEPISAAVLRSVLESQVLAMDETSIRAGRKKAPDARRGQMKTGYYWPLYGDRDEVYFSFSPSRGTQHVMTLLKDFAGTLLTDGYAAYDRFADRQDAVTHAACWSHTRRYFERALEAEPALAHQGLDFIAAVYAHERIIRNKNLDDEKRRDYRSRHHRDAIDAFFLWCRDQLERADLIIEGSPLIKAVRYAQNHEAGLRVCLENPAVPLDTNHLERALRAIPMGRKAWLFCWTEVGAQYVGTLQTLLVTCRLHGVDPFTYLVDVLQRVGQHPASRVSELIPRVWKEKFDDDPLRSYVDR